METVAIKAESREAAGGKGARDVRRNGLIPAVVYGGEEVAHVAISLNDLRHAVYTPDFKLVDLDIDGKQVRCIVKDIQFHPVSEHIVHVDFLRLTPGQPVKVDVPVRFEGVSPGVRNGGKLTQKLRRISIKTTPEEMVDELVFDISSLVLGSSIRVKDAKVGPNIEILNSPSIPVASVHVPRALKGIDEEGEEEEGEEGEEGAEGEGSEESAPQEESAE